jgi:parallel beta-helix repeat protein
MKSSSQLRVFLWAIGAALLAGTCSSAGAATLCVNPSGAGGCYVTIGTAVTAANPGDTIQVATGKYLEDVVVGKPLSLIGTDRSNTIIDATGKANGIYIDGRDNPGLRQVVVAGFTIQNAKFEGILVTNASSVTTSDNRVVSNDLALNPSPPPTCPGQPSFETNEDFDCGEGIHLSGVDHSILANNLMENNSGGILLSDDTGATHDNLITGNIARNRKPWYRLEEPRCSRACREAVPLLATAAGSNEGRGHRPAIRLHARTCRARDFRRACGFRVGR